MTPIDQAHETPVLFETDGPIAIITLNRPDQRNCVNGALANALRDAVRRLEADPALRVAVLRGRGRVFRAGMDLKAFSYGAAEEIIFGEGRFGGFVSLDRTKPIIAAVHGAALACDMAIAERSCKFGLPEARLGLLAAAGGVFRLSSRISVVKARELILTGALFGAEDADRFGLLNAVVDDGMAFESAISLAAKITESAPQSVRDGLKLSKHVERQVEQSLWEESDRMIRDILASDDAKEGARAFQEKRAPVWSTPQATKG